MDLFLKTLSANAIIIEFSDDIKYDTPDIINKETVVDAEPNDSKKIGTIVYQPFH